MSRDGFANGGQHYDHAIVYFDPRDADPDLWAEEYEGEVRILPSGFVDCVELDQLIPAYHVDTINYGAEP